MSSSTEPLKPVIGVGSKLDGDHFPTMQEQFDAFKAQYLRNRPEYLLDAEGDGIKLNFQIIHWYQREKRYILIFRIIFALMFYAVPFTITALLRALSITSKETGAIVELLIVGTYTGPIFSRALSETKLLFKRVQKCMLILMQVDVVLMFIIYLTSTSTSSKGQLGSFLAGLGWTIPAFIGWIICAYKGYTHYAFGFIGKYNNLPKQIVEDFNKKPLPLLDRMYAFGRGLKADVKGVGHAVASVGSAVVRRKGSAAPAGADKELKVVRSDEKKGDAPSTVAEDV